MTELVAGRAYARVYRLSSRRAAVHERLLRAVEVSGGRLIYASQPDRAPVYLGVETPSGERVGVLAYPFTANQVLTKGRPADEHRLQIRYGSEKSWTEREHPLGRDIAYTDTTLVLGVHVDLNLFVGLDPALYNPLPMGISVEFKQSQVDAALQSPHGWHVFERDNITGVRRTIPRARDGLETVVLFKPERLLDYVRLERIASDLSLDPALRFTTAAEASTPGAPGASAVASTHDLEEQFAMTSAEILEMISDRNRLAVAVRGGVAEHHLGKALASEPGVAALASLDKDGQHDFDVTLTDSRLVRVECKNCSPAQYANGDLKVEVQKTRASKNDPASRFYRADQFDILAACLYAPTGEWRFAYRPTRLMERHPEHAERLAVLHHVSPEWPRSFEGVCEQL
ncbi:hypothetical protein [Pseudonocardia sp.]|uniref:hypothetical protein n=1 Tax=Pseudonocardia sp. TaxID=60912 RepID=UPI003D0E2BF7